MAKLKKISPIIALIDIVDVLNLLSDTYHLETRAQRSEEIPLRVWPAPISFAVLRALDTDPRYQPVWMTAWGENAHHWNHRARTREWDVAYPLTRQQAVYMKHAFPRLYRLYKDFGIDRKLVAALYYLRHRSNSAVVWWEDGFSQETIYWAQKRPHTTLVDTTLPQIRDFLLAEHANLDSAAHQFLSTYYRQNNWLEVTPDSEAVSKVAFALRNCLGAQKQSN